MVTECQSVPMLFMRDLHSPELSSYTEPSPLLTSDTGIFQTYDPVLYGTSTGYAVDAYKKRNRGQLVTVRHTVQVQLRHMPSCHPIQAISLPRISTSPLFPPFVPTHLQLLCLSNINHGCIPSSFHVVDSVRVNQAIRPSQVPRRSPSLPSPQPLWPPAMSPTVNFAMLFSSRQLLATGKMVDRPRCWTPCRPALPRLEAIS